MLANRLLAILAIVTGIILFVVLALADRPASNAVDATTRSSPDSPESTVPLGSPSEESNRVDVTESSAVPEASPEVRESEATEAIEAIEEAVGVVVDCHGDGVSAVRVRLESGRETVTDASGRFSFPGLASGDHRVFLDPDTLPPGTGVPWRQALGRREVARPGSVSIEPGRDVRIELAVPDRVVVVTGIGGEPIADATIAVRTKWEGPDPERVHYILRTDGNGRSRLRAPAPGEYEASLFPPWPGTRARPEPIEVRIECTELEGDVLELAFVEGVGGSTVLTRVFDVWGAPVTGVHLEVWRKTPDFEHKTRFVRGAVKAAARADEAGSVRFEGLGPGVYVVYRSTFEGPPPGTVFVEEQSSLEFEILSEAEQVNLVWRVTLVPECSIEGVVPDSIAPGERRNTEVHATVETVGGQRVEAVAEVSREGRFALDGLPTGAASLRLVHTDPLTRESSVLRVADLELSEDQPSRKITSEWLPE